MLGHKLRQTFATKFETYATFRRAPASFTRFSFVDQSHAMVSQRDGRVRGFKQAIFSGFTTQALADVIAKAIAEYPDLHGVWHVAAEPISKFDLLTLVKQTYGLAINCQSNK